MRCNADRYHRRSIRLPRHDYARGGVYLMTLCTYERESLFGTIINGTMHRNELGEIVREEWLRTSIVRPGLRIDAFVVMPDNR